MKKIGNVTALWRYPVKSLRGERCDQLQLEHRGVQFDRQFAVVDGSGKFGSHKTTRRFIKMDGLYQLSAAVVNGEVALQFPDERWIACNESAIDDELSRVLNQPVRLRPEGSIAHHDEGPVHIVTTASLRWLQGLLPESQIDPRRFRPNLVIDVDGDEPFEQSWIGSTLTIGASKLLITSSTERCVMTNIAQSELALDKAILKTLGQYSDAQFGVYARVLEVGPIVLAAPVLFGAG